MSSALDEELRRLEVAVANSTPTAVGTKERCVAQIVAALQPAAATTTTSCRGTTSSSQKRRLWVSPLDGAPPRARQRTTSEPDQSSNDTIMNNNDSETHAVTPAAIQQHADEETGGGGRSNDAVQHSLEIDHYKKLMDQCRQEDEKNKQENGKKIEAIRELRRVYLFGLLKVSKLQDLREAPDAILPGNFVDNNSLPS